MRIEKVIRKARCVCVCVPCVLQTTALLPQLHKMEGSLGEKLEGFKKVVQKYYLELQKIPYAMQAFDKGEGMKEILK
jgi:hypothetical protein